MITIHRNTTSQLLTRARLALKAEKSVLALISVITIGLAGGFSPALAEDGIDVNWASLNLNSNQSTQINAYESEWQKTCAELMPQIESDKSQLMKLMNSPSADEEQIMALQQRISKNKTTLQNKAMQIYLKKKHQLDPNQQKGLQKMMRTN